MEKIWLSLGSNMGSRTENIQRAVDSLENLLSDIKTASLYETAPLENTEQGYFLNTVVSGRTELNVHELLDAIHRIELSGGRKRTIYKGPRTIDIDILLYGENIINEGRGMSRIVVPHERMHQRLFVLRPLVELDPELTDPRDGVLWKNKAELLSDQKVLLYNEQNHQEAVFAEGS